MIKLRQFYVFKLQTSRIAESNYSINLTVQQARENGELIQIGDNQVFRTIRNIKNEEVDFKYIDELFNKRDKLKKENHSEENSKEIQRLQNEIDSILYFPDIINVKVDDRKVYKKIFKEYFTVNGITYRRFCSGAGQSRQSVASFINIELFDKVNKALNCGLNIKEINIAKYNAYFGLNMSATYPVSTPRICIIPDCEEHVIKEKVDWIEDEEVKYKDKNGNEKTKIERKVIEKDFDFIPNMWDGQGLISPTFAKQWQEDLELDYLPATFGVRSTFIKGLLVTFDFHKFASEVANTTKIKDIYGDVHDIKNIDCILTKSQFKMTKFYKSTEQFTQLQKVNNLGWGVTKINPKADKEMSLLNYQYIQTLQLKKEDIQTLLSHTIDWIEKICNGDKLYTLLFLMGVNNGNNSINDIIEDTNVNFVKAILYNDKLLQDPFIKKKLYESISSKIKNAKIGRVWVRGNYQCMISDPYGLAEYAFAEKDENNKLINKNDVRGLLEKGQYYSKFWNDRKVTTVDACRSPMVDFHEHNRINFIHNEKTNEWFKYLDSGIIYHLWGTDTIRHSDSDWDYDIVFTTDNDVILNGIIPNKNVITYEKNTAEAQRLNKGNILKTDLRSFDSKIGQITNYSTSFITMLANFKEDSEEYKELIERIKLLRRYIGDSIDAAKGIKTEPFPVEWRKRIFIDKTESKESKDKKKYRNSLVADKKPYFMIYVYDKLYKEYKDNKRKYERACKEKFGLSIYELIHKKDKNEDEKYFLFEYYRKIPVIKNNSIMNTLCKMVEDIDFKYKRPKNNENVNEMFNILFDDNVQIDNEILNKLIELKKKFNSKRNFKVRDNSLNIEQMNIDENETDYNNSLDNFYNSIRNEAYEVCSNSKTLSNHLVYIVYKYQPNEPKDFAWYICPEGIIETLKEKHNGHLELPVYDSNGVNYLGKNYSLSEVIM